MNRLFGVLLLSILFSCNHLSKTKIVDKWDNGNKKLVYTYDNVDDPLSYLRESFFKNGSLMTTGKEVNGEREGKWLFYYENGNKKHEAYFFKGHYINKRIHWYENGQLKKEEFFDGQCEDDCCDGKRIFYLENGKIENETITKNGDIISSIAYVYNKEGYYSISHFKNNIEDGLYQEFLPNGIIWIEGNYKNGKQDGKWVWRDSTGKDTSVIYMKDGRLIGN